MKVVKSTYSSVVLWGFVFLVPAYSQAIIDKSGVDLPAGLAERLMQSLTHDFFDPTSAQIRSLKMNAGYKSICGEVNGKNRMGAYAGFKPFWFSLRDDSSSIYEAAVEPNKDQLLRMPFYSLHCDYLLPN